MRTLSATGAATASLNVPAKLPIPWGFKLYHSYIVYDGTTGQVFSSMLAQRATRCRSSSSSARPRQRAAAAVGTGIP